MEKQEDGEYCHTSGYSTCAEAWGSPEYSKPRVIAKFQPQAWVNDYAYPVDPAGDPEWDVTDEIVAMGREKALALKDDTYESDYLRYSRHAPKWVQEWSGPFYIEIEEAVRSFYGEN